MQNKRLNEMDVSSNEPQLAFSILQQTRNYFLTTYAAVTERSINTLLLVNGGGVVTVLAYLHASARTNNVCLTFAWISYLTGIFFTISVVACDQYVCTRYLKTHVTNVQQFNLNAISLADAQVVSTPNLEKIATFSYPCGWLALAWFFVGCVLGLEGYFS
jgi:hypothetical protein